MVTPRSASSNATGLQVIEEPRSAQLVAALADLAVAAMSLRRSLELVVLGEARPKGADEKTMKQLDLSGW